MNALVRFQPVNNLRHNMGIFPLRFLLWADKLLDENSTNTSQASGKTAASPSYLLGNGVLRLQEVDPDQLLLVSQTSAVPIGLPINKGRIITIAINRKSTVFLESKSH